CYLLTQTVIPERHAYVLLTADGRQSYLVCNIEERSARSEATIEDIRTYVEFAEKPEAAAATLLREQGLAGGRIGYEAHTLPAGSLARLQAGLPDATFIPWDTQFAATLMVKNEAEVAAIETAGRLTQAAIVDGLTGAAPGSSELAVANRILKGIMDAGIVPMFNVFAAGDKLLQAHAEADNRVMQPGEIVRLDMGGRMSSSNYLSDMARTAVVGAASPAQAATYAALLDIQLSVMDAARPGRTIASLFEVCATGFARHNLPFQMPHIGHGMGIGLHEAPMIHPANQTVIEPGMVLNIEPLVIIPERGECYHTEDLLVVTDSAPRYPTTPQPTLITIPA
ncbi:MAG: aminopeptidase P family protein, partial [Anaerolineales bacterium]|nr:aminopeptidase P family protein [Anaerolineales bacterium]